MATLPSGSEKILELFTSKIHLAIRAAGRAHKAPAGALSTVRVSAYGFASIRIMGEERETGDAAAYTDLTLRVPPLFREEGSYELILRSLQNEPIAFYHENSALREAVKPAREGDETLLTGVIAFSNEVGYTEFEILTAGERHAVLRLEVFPSPISYREDYRAMLSEVAEMTFEAALDFWGKTYRLFASGGKKEDVPALYMTILHQIFDAYLLAARRIAASPRQKLAAEHMVLPAPAAGYTDRESEKWLQKHPDALIKGENGLKAARVLAVKKSVSYDTGENKLAAAMLRSAVKRLREFAGRYRETAEPDPEALDEAEKMAGTLSNLIEGSFLGSLPNAEPQGKVPLLFHMTPGYRELWKYDRLLGRGLAMGGDVFRCSVRDTATLYEYWCFLKLTAMLKNAAFRRPDGGLEYKYRLASPDVIRVDHTGVTVTLKTGQSSELRFLNTLTGELFSLVYRPGGEAENAITLEKSGEKLIFSAKYRVDEAGGPKSADVDAMYRVRTAAGGDPGAVVLFPSGDEEAYRAHPAYKSLEKLRVGGLPFLPGATALVEELLGELTAAGSENLFCEPLSPALEEELQRTDWRVKDVLVASFRNEAQYQINFEKKFYHTAVRNVPADRLPVRYIALCRPKAWQDAGIRYIGEVEKVRVVKRKRIPLPLTRNNGDEEYYYFKIKRWEALPETITVREEGVYAPRFTNRLLLHYARETHELFHASSEEEFRLAAALRLLTERKEDTAVRLREDRVLWARGGVIDLLGADGTLLMRVSASDLARAPGYYLRSISEVSVHDQRNRT